MGAAEIGHESPASPDNGNINSPAMSSLPTTTPATLRRTPRRPAPRPRQQTAKNPAALKPNAARLTPLERGKARWVREEAQHQREPSVAGIRRLRPAAQRTVPRIATRHNARSGCAQKVRDGLVAPGPFVPLRTQRNRSSRYGCLRHAQSASATATWSIANERNPTSVSKKSVAAASKNSPASKMTSPATMKATMTHQKVASQFVTEQMFWCGA